MSSMARLPEAIVPLPVSTTAAQMLADAVDVNWSVIFTFPCHVIGRLIKTLKMTGMWFKKGGGGILEIAHVYENDTMYMRMTPANEVHREK